MRVQSDLALVEPESRQRQCPTFALARMRPALPGLVRASVPCAEPHARKREVREVQAKRHSVSRYDERRPLISRGSLTVARVADYG